MGLINLLLYLREAVLQDSVILMHHRLEVTKEIRRVAQAQRTSEEAAMLIVNLHQQQTRYSIDQL